MYTVSVFEVLLQHAVTQPECCLEYLSSYPMGFKNYQMVQQQQKNWHTELIQGGHHSNQNYFIYDFAIQKKKFNKAPRKKKTRAYEHDPRYPNDQKVHFQDYLQLFSSLRECKPNTPINKLYQPSKFRPPENNFFFTF